MIKWWGGMISEDKAMVYLMRQAMQSQDSHV